MSGHSKWATIKRAKGATDSKRGALFTKLSKNISIAAKKGKDPDMNSALRVAITAAREVNMPKDVVERAILRGAGELPGQIIEELTYEAYGPHGIALLVHCATDNTNRTVSFLKSTLSKYGGNLGGPGSVSFLFKQKGVIRSTDVSEAMQLAVMEAGADDIIEEDDGMTIYTTPANFPAVKQAVDKNSDYAELSMIPDTTIVITEPAHQGSFEQLLNLLEDNDDVMTVTHNAHIN